MVKSADVSSPLIFGLITIQGFLLQHHNSINALPTINLLSILQSLNANLPKTSVAEILRGMQGEHGKWQSHQPSSFVSPTDGI
jgi:hypothetical protein